MQLVILPLIEYLPLTPVLARGNTMIMGPQHSVCLAVIDA